MNKISIVAQGLKYIEQSSIHGKEYNKIIAKFISDILGNKEPTDEVPWCSAYLNAVMKDLGLKGTNSLLARSWLEWGQKTSKPEMGDIVVFWRESKTSWKGHVAIYIAESEDSIYALGGNQSDEVSIAKYPKEKVLDYRSLY